MIIGHQKIKAFFEKNIEKNGLFHAYIFSGPEHVGKFKFAHELAIRLVGKEKNKINPDIIILKPEAEEKRGVIKKKDIKIETIRVLEHELNLSAYFGGFKVAIIDDAEYLTRSAQNALLKTLEEPAEKIIIILVVQNKEKIIPTVASRCQEIKFKLVSDREISEMVPEANSEAKDIILWSMNRPGLTYNFLRNLGEIKKIQKEEVEFRKIFSSTVSDILGLAEKISKDISDLERKLEIWTVILRARSEYSNLLFIERIEESLKNIQETNANPRLIIENLLLDMALSKD